MKLQETVSRALTDPTYAAELKKHVLKAISSGNPSQAWSETLEQHFAATPETLQTFKASFGDANVKGATTTTTVTVTTTGECLITTTTTTTSDWSGCKTNNC